MARKQFNIQVQVSKETKEEYQKIFDELGASGEEFLKTLMENYKYPEIIENEKVIERIVERPIEKIVEKPIEVIKEVEKLVEVIKEVDKNQILISLNPAQQAILEKTSQDEETIEIHNYNANRESIQRKYPDLLLPLIEGENNIGRVLTNLFFIQVIDGPGDHICFWPGREIRKVFENLSESNNIDDLDNIE